MSTHSRFLCLPAEILEAVVELAAQAQEWSLCVAWASAAGGDAIAWKRLAPHFPKLRRAIVGLAFHQTEPWVLRQLHGLGVLRTVVSASGTFHPKVYVFRSGTNYSTVIGSPNFTGAAFSANCETAVLTTCPSEHEFALRVESFMEKTLAEARLLTLDELDRYEKQAAALAPLRQKLAVVELSPSNNKAEARPPEPTMPQLNPLPYVWMIAAGRKYFQETDRHARDDKDLWPINPKARRGDVALMYCLTPRSALVAVYRCACDAYPDPKLPDFGGDWTTITDKVAIPWLTLKEFKADPVIRKWKLARRNLRGLLKYPYPVPDEVWQRIKKLIASKDKEAGQLLEQYAPATPKGAGE